MLCMSHMWVPLWHTLYKHYKHILNFFWIYYENAVWNRYVLNKPLKLSKLLVLLMLVGSLFYSVGATCFKDLAVNIFVWLRLHWIRFPHCWISCFPLICSLTDIGSCRYFGADLLIHMGDCEYFELYSLSYW